MLALLLICFNFGIPPAKISPNCGAPIPGIGGADIEGPLLLTVPELPEADETTPPPTIGALLSLVSAFFSFIPFLMSPNRASRPCITDFAGLGALPPNAGGGGGGGGAGAPAFQQFVIYMVGFFNKRLCAFLSYALSHIKNFLHKFIILDFVQVFTDCADYS